MGHVDGAVGLACGSRGVLVAEGYLGDKTCGEFARSVELLCVCVVVVGAGRRIVPCGGASAADVVGGRTGAVAHNVVCRLSHMCPLAVAGTEAGAVGADVDVVEGGALKARGGVGGEATGERYGCPCSEIGDSGVADDDLVVGDKGVVLRPGE